MPAPSPTSIPDQALDIAFALALAFALAAASSLVIGRLARRWLTAVGRPHLVSDPLIPATVRIIRLVTLLLAFAIFAFPALDLAGVDLRVGLQSRQVGQWAATTGIRIVALLLLTFAVVRILTAVILRAERDIAPVTGLDSLERRKRAQTIAGIVRRALAILIWSIAVLIVLRELDVDITPVLTGAGIAGLAVGFGAQTLVRDVITGFFLIIEDQVRVGDVAMVNGIGGLVEQINLRTIVLRDFEGVVHVVPNGEIKTLANRTKDYSYYVIDLGVSYEDDTDRIVALVRNVGAELMADPALASSILEPVEVVGVDDFKESAVTLRFRIKTIPLKQWEVGRELRRRIKKALDREGIRIPGPKLDVTISRFAKASERPDAPETRPNP
jgi:moderate conductance mechanosensitive channel